MKLFHATAEENLASIRQSGLSPVSYWTACDDIAAYYRETIADEGKTPVLLAIDLSLLDKSVLEPDHPGIDEPITTVLGLSEEEVRQSWADSTQDWRASLEVVRSMRYRACIPATLLQLEVGDELQPLIAQVT